MKKPDSEECREALETLGPPLHDWPPWYRAAYEALKFCAREPDSQDNGAGQLEVGTNDSRQVVINLPIDMTGHIVFSPNESRYLARVLMRKADEAER